jgi:uncharacterized protein (DUF1499 family)
MSPNVQKRIAFVGLLLGAASLAVLVLAGPGSRVGLWHFRFAFTLMRYAAYGGIAAAAISLVGAGIGWRRQLPVARCLLGLALGAIAAWIPWHALQQAKSLPPIHDVSTDTVYPPDFQAVLPLRGEGSNPVAYGGPELAAQQQAAYPEIAPLYLDKSAPEVFMMAHETAKRMGWEIVASDGKTGRIEATATSFWFGFKDDVVIRVVPQNQGGTRVDVRSLSRVGGSDIGANARRIGAYFRYLKSLD